MSFCSCSGVRIMLTTDCLVPGGRPVTVRTIPVGAGMHGLTAAQILNAAGQVGGKQVIIVTTVSALHGKLPC